MDYFSHPTRKINDLAPIKTYELSDDFDDLNLQTQSVWREFVEFNLAIAIVIIFSVLSFYCGIFIQQQRAVEAGVAVWHQGKDGVAFKFIDVPKEVKIEQEK